MTGISSSRWDKVYQDFQGQRSSVWKEKATPFFVEKIPFLKENNVEKILDAGCGDGRNLVTFAKAGFHMVGADSSLEACKRSEFATRDFPHTVVVQQDLMNLNMNNTFDAIVCDYVFVHLEDPRRVIDNLLKVLKPSGFFLVEFFSIDDPSYGEGEQVSHNAFMSHGIFSKFYSLEDTEELLDSFHILETQKIRHEDPDHVDDFPRSKKHEHESIYVLCQKPKK
jgi:SAM-dependent methyltransferase